MPASHDQAAAKIAAVRKGQLTRRRRSSSADAARNGSGSEEGNSSKRVGLIPEDLKTARKKTLGFAERQLGRLDEHLTAQEEKNDQYVAQMVDSVKVRIVLSPCPRPRLLTGCFSAPGNRWHR